MTVGASCLACGGPLNPAATLVAPDRLHRIAGRWSIHTCRRCDSGTTLPLASEDELGAFYPQTYAPFEVPTGVLARVMGRVQRGRDSRFPLASLASSGSPGTLLDVGCGRGDLAASWIARGWKVLGVEPSPQAAETARLRGTQIVGRTFADADISPGSVDAVVFRHSLEHVPEPRVELDRVFTALRPGGRLALIVPNWGSWQRRAFGEYWFPLELPRHRTHFTADGLSMAISCAGLAGLDVRSATPFITTTWSLQFRSFGRLLTEHGAALLAGYAASAPISVVASLLDRVLGGGDFLHAAAAKPSSA